MKYLFSDDGAAELARLATARALYAFDFDGTLAPIGPQPDRVRTPARVMRRLRRLAQSAPVAVISGRRRADLVARLPGTVRYLVGNHGNEGGPLAIDPAAMRAVCSGWRAQIDAWPVVTARRHSVQIEDKALSLSLHYRRADDHERAAAWLESCIARLVPPPRVIGGKRVFNLLPAGARTKFEALAAIAAAERAEAVLFVGDDDTDELVFAQAPAHWLTVRVELHDASDARYFLPEQSGVAVLLDRLVKSRLRFCRGAGRT